MKIKIALVMCLWTTCVYAQLQQEVQQCVPPVTAETEGAAKSTTEKDGPQKNLSCGPTSLGNKTQSDKAQQTQDRTNTESSRWTDPITIFTFFLTVFTALTWWTYQGILTSTKAIERAYVKMSQVSQILEPMQVNETPLKKGYLIDMEVKNWGNTPALVTHRLLTFDVLPKGEELPAVPDYRKGKAMPVGFFLVKGDAFYFGEFFEIDREELKKCGSPGQTHTLYILGYIDYTDKFGIRHRAGYAREYSPTPGEGTFSGVDQPGYNYDRKRGKDDD